MFLLGVVVGLLIALLLGFYLAGQTEAAESKFVCLALRCPLLTFSC